MANEQLICVSPLLAVNVLLSEAHCMLSLSSAAHVNCGEHFP